MESNKLAKVYNKFVIDMVLNLKLHSSRLKTALKSKYRAIDPNTTDHLVNAASKLNLAKLLETDPSGVPAAIQEFEPLCGLAISEFVDELSGKSAESLITYLHILAVLCATHIACSGEDDAASGSAILIDQVLSVLGKAQQGESVEDAKSAILDDDIVALLNRIEDLSSTATKGNAPTATGFDSFEDAFKGSSIANMAKEISDEIDISNLPLPENPMDMFNFANLTDKNSMLGNIVSKVGSKMQNKLQSGELTQEELLGEALGMLKMFNDKKMLPNDLARAASDRASGSSGTRAQINTNALRTMSMRERLRQKHAAKSSSTDKTMSS